NWFIDSRASHHITSDPNNLVEAIPTQDKNLVSVSKFAHDNHANFEFHSSVCFVKSQVDQSILLRGYLGPDGLYQFLLFRCILHPHPLTVTCSNTHPLIIPALASHHPLLHRPTMYFKFSMAP
ncbi:hypothetical protein V8G54_001564, partial [Vigna mungo]